MMPVIGRFAAAVGLGLGLALALMAAPAWAQGFPVHQLGTASPGTIAAFARNGQIDGSSGGERGVNPFSILDGGGIGLSLNTAKSSGPYRSLTLGHDGAGNGLIALDSYDGAPPGTLKCRINGVVSDCLSTRDSLGAMPRIDARSDHGMVCDGTTDDTASLQAAITAAATRGNAVFISGNPGGGSTTCMLGSPVELPSNSTLWAVPGTVTLKMRVGNTGGLAYTSGKSNVYVYGLTFDGGGQDFASNANITLAYASVNVIFDNVRWQNTRGLAVLFSAGIANSGVRNSTFNNIGNRWKTTLLTSDRVQAIAFCCGLLSNNFGNFATGNYFYDIGLDPVSAGNQRDFLMSHNRAVMENGQLTAAWNAPLPTAFGGFYAVSSDQATVTNNIVEGASGNCIDLFNVRSAIITNNYAVNCGQAGIGFFGTDAIIANNITKNNYKWGGGSFTGGVALSNAAGMGNVTLSGNVSSDDQAAISTTCSGTVAIGATSCTAASIAGMIVGDHIRIAGAGVAGANLNTSLTAVSGTTTIWWRTPTSTSTSGAAVTGIPTQAYGYQAIAGTTFVNLSLDGSNVGSGNVTSLLGGPLTSRPIQTSGYAVASLPAGTVGMIAHVTDQITACPARGVAPTAGGALKCPVFYNGAWGGL